MRVKSISQNTFRIRFGDLVRLMCDGIRVSTFKLDQSCGGSWEISLSSKDRKHVNDMKNMCW